MIKVTSKINFGSMWVKLTDGKEWAKLHRGRYQDKITCGGIDMKKAHTMGTFVDKIFCEERGGDGTMGDTQDRIIKRLENEWKGNNTNNVATKKTSEVPAEETDYKAAWTTRKALRVKHNISDDVIGLEIPTIGTLIGMKKGARKNQYIVKRPNGKFVGVDHSTIKAAI